MERLLTHTATRRPKQILRLFQDRTHRYWQIIEDPPQ